MEAFEKMTFVHGKIKKMVVLQNGCQETNQEPALGLNVSE